MHSTCLSTGMHTSPVPWLQASEYVCKLQLQVLCSRRWASLKAEQDELMGCARGQRHVSSMHECHLCRKSRQHVLCSRLLIEDHCLTSLRNLSAATTPRCMQTAQHACTLPLLQHQANSEEMASAIAGRAHASDTQLAGMLCGIKHAISTCLEQLLFS